MPSIGLLLAGLSLFQLVPSSVLGDSTKFTVSTTSAIVGQPFIATCEVIDFTPPPNEISKLNFFADGNFLLENERKSYIPMRFLKSPYNLLFNLLTTSQQFDHSHLNHSQSEQLLFSQGDPSFTSVPNLPDSNNPQKCQTSGISPFL